LVERKGAADSDRLNALGQFGQDNGEHSCLAIVSNSTAQKLTADTTAAANFARLLLWQNKNEVESPTAPAWPGWL